MSLWCFFYVQVFLQVCRFVRGHERPIIRLEIFKLGTELNIRTYDMTANAFLREICLTCPEYMGKCHFMF